MSAIENAPAATKQTGATLQTTTNAMQVDYSNMPLVGEDYPSMGTSEDAAAYLNLRPAAIRELCRSGRLKAIKCGSHWRIPRAYLQEFILEGGCHE